VSVADNFVSVELRPANVLLPALVTAHAATALVLALTLPWNRLLAAVLSLLAANVGWLLLRRDPMCAAARFELSGDGNCSWQRAQQIETGRLRTDTIALPWLIVLRFNAAARRSARFLILFPGSMAREDWRRLQVFLKWGVRFSGAASISSGEP
jgi:hypothetical protein